MIMSYALCERVEPTFRNLNKRRGRPMRRWSNGERIAAAGLRELNDIVRTLDAPRAYPTLFEGERPAV